MYIAIKKNSVFIQLQKFQNWTWLGIDQQEKNNISWHLLTYTFHSAKEQSAIIQHKWTNPPNLHKALNFRFPIETWTPSSHEINRF